MRHEEWKLLQEMLEKADSIAIFWHRNIDGDCVGSCLGIGTLLTNQGKTVSYFCPDRPMEDWEFVEKINLFQTQFDYTKTYDLLIFLDTGNNTSQLKDFWVANPEYFTNHSWKIVIDHHQSNQWYGDLNIIDASASSACELVAELIFDLYPDGMTKEIATLLFMGISTDTGHFFYDDDYGRTFGIASQLLGYGVDKKSLVNHLYRSNSLTQVQFVGHLIQKIEKNGNVLYTWLTQHELDKRWLDGQHIEHILPIIQSIEHDGVVLFFKANENDSVQPHLRISFRTKNPNIDVAELASNFNGGGHRMSAGWRVPITGSVLETIKQVIDSVNTLLTQ